MRDPSQRSVARRATHILQAAALALAVATVATEVAEAQTPQPQPTLCIRKATPLPFGRGSDPVWFSGLSGRTDVISDLNEPRWGNSPLTAFFNDQGNLASNEGGVRFILSDDSKELSVSIQNKSGVPANTDMGVFFGIHNDATGVGYAFQTTLYTQSLVNAGIYNTAARTQLVSQATKSGTGAAWVPNNPSVDPSLNPAIVTNSLAQWSSAAGNSTVEGGADWAIQFRIGLLARLGIGPSTPFRVFVGMRRLLDTGKENLVSAPWVNAAPPPAAQPPKIQNMAIPTDTSLWQTMPTLATGCPSGIVVKGGSIGTTNSDPQVINTDAGVPNTTNTFVADIDPGNQAVGPNQLKARFRVANWGAQVENRWSDEWRDVPKGSAVLNSLPAGGTAATRFTFNCGANTPGFVCDTLSVPADAHQCMVVEVNNNGSANNKLITTGNAYNNMRFLPLSAKTDNAAISIRGLLNKHGKAGDREVIIKVVTRNMPTISNMPIFLDFQLLNWVKTILVSVVNFVNPWGRSLSDTDMMRVAWPTYEVHVYYDTGRSNTYRTKTYKEYSPLVSYGYYVSHEGVFFGYNHKLLGASRSLNPVAGSANTWRVTVPTEGRVFVTNAIASEDLPALLVPPGDRTCQIWPQLCQE